MESIFPIDLFSFIVSPAVIRDAYFINPDAGYPGYLGRHLWLKPEPFFFQGDLLNNIRPEQLITGFHVSEIQVGKHIGQGGKHFIPDGMPEKKYPVWICSHES